MDIKKQKPEIKEIILTLEGDLMNGGSLNYKTLFDVIEGSVGAIEGFSRITNFNQTIDYRLKPPKEKCFEISLQAIQQLGLTIPLIQSAGTIKDIVSIFIEYLKIKKALGGEELKRENIQTNNNGGVNIKNNQGVIIYNDNRNILNINLVKNAVEDPQINKRIGKIFSSLERDTEVDSIIFTDPDQKEDNSLNISKKEASYFKYSEKFEEESDKLVGYVRKIDNKTSNGMVTVIENDKEKSVVFELDIKEIELLEKIVRDLALAEANNARVVFSGEKILDSQGKIKKIIVNDIDIIDHTLDF